MYELHLRRLRRRNTARRDALMDAIEKYLGARVAVTGDGSGTHVVLWPGKRISETAAIAKAAARGVGIYKISHCYLAQPAQTGLMLGYSRLNEQEIQEGIRRLGEIL
jgi:GntR family transcriptional regulator/MocR family aminotransferase